VATLTTALVVGLAVLSTNQSAAARMPGGHDSGRAAVAASAKVRTIAVDRRLFGVHDAFLHSLSRPGTGSIRLWDTGTAWPQMQPTNGPIDFTRLDQVVRAAHAHHVEVTLVVAMTPAWAAASSAHTAQTDPPRLAAFKSYLSAVMTRYKNFFGPGKRGIANYQVWNEANISTFWTGSQAQMGQLVRAAWQVRQHVDRGARLIGPSMVARLGYQQKWIHQFYRTRVGGKAVWRYADALGFSMYPVDTVPAAHGTRPAMPEDSIALLRLVKGFLKKDKVPAGMPLWNNEVNYGLHTAARAGTAARPIPAARQVAYVMRTYLLNAAAGVKRVYWYAYDMGTLPGGGTLGNTLLTDPTNRAAGILTPAGRALPRIRSWMTGTLVGTATKAPCATDRKGTYTCVIKYKKGVGRIYWNPLRSVKVTLVRSATSKVTELGATSKAKGGTRLTVDYRPVLVRSAH
jgi:hypothetical protein